MTLIDYLESINKSQRQLSFDLGITTTTLSRMTRGLEEPSPTEIRLIYDATGGNVGINDWSILYENVGRWINVVHHCQSSGNGKL